MPFHRALHHILKVTLILGSVVTSLTACGPTGNRLNIGVIADPRTQFDANTSTGNTGTVIPTNPGANATVVDPSLTSPSTGDGGANSSSNTNQQTNGSPTPGGIFSLDISGATTRASSPTWSLAVGPDGAFVLQHRVSPNGGIDLTLSGAETQQADGSLLLTILGRQGSALPDLRSGTIIPGIDWANRLIVLSGGQSGLEMAALAVGATCPSADLNGIWLEDTLSAPSPATGTLNYTASTATAIRSMAIDTATGQMLSGRSYSNGACGMNSVLGVMSVAASGDFGYVSMSSNGVGVLSDGTTESLAVPTPMPLTLAGLAGDFVALIGSSGNATVAHFHCDDLGTCSDNAAYSLQIVGLNTIANGTATGQWVGAEGLSAQAACIAGVNEGQPGQIDLMNCRTTSASPESLVFVRKTP